jgi:outer membrane protein OmpA-like peptidoglycan-associated protein
METLMRELHRHSWLSIPLLLLLASCSSPPKPPTVDESQKRPANTAMAVELQVCRNDLQNTRILATESGRIADSTTATLQQLAARQQAFGALQERAPVPAPAPKANSLFAVRFDFGSTRLAMPAELSAALVEEARSAPLVVLKGRTDGTADSLAESRVARERAAAVRDFLIAAGVDVSRIRVTWQPVGDHAADNTDAGGRSLNRRVEIEVYRALPVPLGMTAGLAGSAGSQQP